MDTILLGGADGSGKGGRFRVALQQPDGSNGGNWTTFL